MPNGLTWNTRKPAFLVNAFNKEEAMNKARSRLQVEGYVVSRVTQLPSGMPIKGIQETFRVFVRKTKR